MPKKYRIHLTEAERLELKALVAAGKAAAPKRLRAQILLAADEDHPGGAMKDAEIIRALGVSICTVERTRCALAEHGLQELLQLSIQSAGILARSAGDRPADRARLRAHHPLAV